MPTFPGTVAFTKSSAVFDFPDIDGRYYVFRAFTSFRFPDGELKSVALTVTNVSDLRGFHRVNSIDQKNNEVALALTNGLILITSEYSLKTVALPDGAGFGNWISGETQNPTDLVPDFLTITGEGHDFKTSWTVIHNPKHIKGKLNEKVEKFSTKKVTFPGQGSLYSLENPQQFTVEFSESKLIAKFNLGLVVEGELTNPVAKSIVVQGQWPGFRVEQTTEA